MGAIDSIKVKAPHAVLISTLTEIFSKFPEMIPGKFKNEPVDVKYAIPFTIIIEETRAQRKARRKLEKDQ